MGGSRESIQTFELDRARGGRKGEKISHQLYIGHQQILTARCLFFFSKGIMAFAHK